jgi:membrane dipeptidase
MPADPHDGSVHASALVIDTHADTPQRFVDERYDLADPLKGGNLNLESASAGNLGAEFFSIWVEPEQFKGKYAARALELIRSVLQQVERHADRVALVTSTEGIESAYRARRFAALMGVEGGHAIENSLERLREFYDLGVRYMTLTWSNSNDWANSSGDADDATVPHTKDGLTEFGLEVVREMNRLGMIVDISHVADSTFYRAQAVSQAPVIASHSGARALCSHPRNMTDDMLRAVATSGGPGSGGGTVQVNFFSGFVSQSYWDAMQAAKPAYVRAVRDAQDRARGEGRDLAFAERESIRTEFLNRIPRPPFALLIDQLDHVARVAGVDHAGLGSDFDGVMGHLPEGMDSAADLPKVTAALLDRGYSADDCRKILGGNVLRVFREVEAVARRLRSESGVG